MYPRFFFSLKSFYSITFSTFSPSSHPFLLVSSTLRHHNIIIALITSENESHIPNPTKKPNLFAEIYQMMLSDKRYGLTVNMLSTRVLPLLIPQMVNTQLQYEDYVYVHQVLQEMFDHVDK